MVVREFDRRGDIWPRDGVRDRSTAPLALSSGPPPGGTETVLLVEDDDALRALLRTILRRAGYASAMICFRSGSNPVMMPLMDRFDPETRSRFRRHLLARGQKLATLLAEVLAGKGNVATIEALVQLRPGIRPEEALRKALDQVEARRILLDRDDDRFGRCDICATDLGATALGEMPWADRCAAHAGI